MVNKGTKTWGWTISTTVRVETFCRQNQITRKVTISSLNQFQPIATFGTGAHRRGLLFVRPDTKSRRARAFWTVFLARTCTWHKIGAVRVRSAPRSLNKPHDKIPPVASSVCLGDGTAPARLTRNSQIATPFRKCCLEQLSTAFGAVVSWRKAQALNRW